MNTGVRTCVFPSLQPGTLDREVVLPMALSCPTFNEYSLDIPSQTCPEAPRSWPPRWFWVPVSYRCDNITIAVSWFFPLCVLDMASTLFSTSNHGQGME